MMAAGDASSSAALVALRNGTLGVGFSGSGFLILYFTGVTAVLQQLGVINNRTRLAGSSGGAINAAATCGGVPTQRQFDINLQLATRCRPSGGCRGFLDAAVRRQLAGSVPPDAAALCNGRLFIAVTDARPGNATDEALLLGPEWLSSAQLVAAASASSFIPGFSGPNLTTNLDAIASLRGRAVYDGGFSDPLPCPLGVSVCVRVSAQAPRGPALEQRSPEFASSLAALNALAASNASSAEARFLPLNPAPAAPRQPDIFPGRSGPLPANLSAAAWNAFALSIPSRDLLGAVYDTGRRDAAAWAGASGAANASAVQAALAGTALPAA